MADKRKKYLGVAGLLTVTFPTVGIIGRMDGPLPEKDFSSWLEEILIGPDPTPPKRSRVFDLEDLLGRGLEAAPEGAIDPPSALAPAPRVKMSEVKNLAGQTGMMVIPFEYLNEELWCGDSDCDLIRAFVERAKIDGLQPYVLTPPGNWSVKQQIRSADYRLPIFAPDSLQQHLAAVEMMVPAVRTQRLSSIAMDRAFQSEREELMASIQGIATGLSGLRETVQAELKALQDLEVEAIGVKRRLVLVEYLVEHEKRCGDKNIWQTLAPLQNEGKALEEAYKARRVIITAGISLPKLVATCPNKSKGVGQSGIPQSPDHEIRMLNIAQSSWVKGRIPLDLANSTSGRETADTLAKFLDPNPPALSHIGFPERLGLPSGAFERIFRRSLGPLLLAVPGEVDIRDYEGEALLGPAMGARFGLAELKALKFNVKNHLDLNEILREALRQKL